MTGLLEHTVLYTPHLTAVKREDLFFFIDGEAPNWIATDQRGAEILGLVNGRRSVGDCVREYAIHSRLDPARAWLHVHTFLKDALRRTIISTTPFDRGEYRGRGHYLTPERLSEFWIHTNNSCNLTCAHCLVSSSPEGDPGLTTSHLKSIIDQASALGVFRYYFTGGEPFLRRDIFELIDYVTGVKGAELIIITNATLFRGWRREGLEKMDRTRLKLQVSCDGSLPRVNDPIRGEGTFARIIEGLKTLSDMGFETSLTAVVMRENLQDMPNLPLRASEVGARSLHLMWPHRRGRACEGNGHFPSWKELFLCAREVKKACDHKGIRFDNYESVALRVNGRPGVKYDLADACWGSLCLYSDGHLYPSASFAGYPPLDLGDPFTESLETIWLTHPLAREFRAATVAQKRSLGSDPFRFFTGGGDIEQGYFWTGDILGEDPYYGLYTGIILDVMEDLVRQKRQATHNRSGDDPPLIFHAMGEEGLVCGDPFVPGEVRTLHSNCVLSFDVEKPYRVVQEFYGKAALEPQPELCCPVSYETEETSHIPQEVLDRFYGCGSPILMAGVGVGETVVDLGSGGGIDCFIAARKVGPTGRVIGIDMTDEMLEIAEKNRGLVAQNLGYDVVEFRKGYLENIPLPDHSAECLTSNCVINLSPNKGRVFSEMWRVLKDHGRAVISDIISREEVPPHVRVNEKLWGECLSGALTEEEFLYALEREGFYGIEVLQKRFYKEVEGYPFFSLTVRGYKQERRGVSSPVTVIYRGPFKAVIDETGHLFPRNEVVEVDSETAERLKRPPYSPVFTISEPAIQIIQFSPTGGTCSPQPGEGKCC